jgi:glycosyltransferase involved in cell wall biosynthesis
MRIGFVTGEYPPMQGGVGAFTQALARVMIAADHEISVFTRAAAAGASEPGIDVQMAVGGRWGWNTNRAIRQWAEEKALDVVNIQFQTAAYDMHPAIHFLPAQLDHQVTIVTFHDLRVPYLFPKAGAAREWVVRRLARTADGVIATNAQDRAILAEQWDIHHTALIPIGSNVKPTIPDDYDRAQWRARAGAGPDDLLIAHFGFLNASKGVPALISALRRLVDAGTRARLVMIGGRAGASDPTNQAHASAIDGQIEALGLGDRIHWSGFVDDVAVSGYFLAADLTALPYSAGVSLRRGTLMAALAHGQAIVTTQPTTPIPELDEAYMAVPSNDPDALATAIAELWHDMPRRKALEKAALKAAVRFEWDAIARQTIDFFQHVLDDRLAGMSQATERRRA